MVFELLADLLAGCLVFVQNLHLHFSVREPWTLLQSRCTKLADPSVTVQSLWSGVMLSTDAENGEVEPIQGSIAEQLGPGTEWDLGPKISDPWGPGVNWDPRTNLNPRTYCVPSL